MDEIIRYAKKIAMRTILFPFRILPIRKNRVMVLNRLSLKYAGNPKTITEYLIKNYPNKFDLVVSVSNPLDYAYLEKKGIRVVKFHSFDYFLNIMTAKVFVTNSGGFSYTPLRKKQYIINTWHGGGAYKTCGIDMYNDSFLFRKDLALQGNSTNAFLSTCKRFTEVVSNGMLVPKEVFWEIGMPRNDMLINEDTELKKEIRAKIGLKDDEKLILFAPTYRKVNDNYFKDSIGISYGVDFDRVCRAMETRFGGKWRFAVRYHPCVTNRGDMEIGNAIDLTDYDDMQELLLASDAMINDFSSSMWDFMLTGRPSFLFATDLEHYVATTNVYTPVSEWPFPKSVNNDELESNILNFNEDDYAAKCKYHYESLGGSETGKASQLVCERIFEVCFNK